MRRHCPPSLAPPRAIVSVRVLSVRSPKVADRLNEGIDPQLSLAYKGC